MHALAPFDGPLPWDPVFVKNEMFLIQMYRPIACWAPISDWATQLQTHCFKAACSQLCIRFLMQSHLASLQPFLGILAPVMLPEWHRLSSLAAGRSCA